MSAQDLTENIEDQSIIPAELNYDENVALKWTIFALFAASAPFVVFLMPKVAGPIILFGALIFCAIFLFSDQHSNMHKNAISLWNSDQKKKKTDIRIDTRAEKEKEFFIHLENSCTETNCQNFIVSLTSDGAKEQLQKLLADKNRTVVKDVEITSIKEVKDLILISINEHRLWCRPWNYQFDYEDEIKAFKD